jgi:spore maturation protein CgeB
VRIVFLGLSITSSWGNGHATNYRSLVAALAARGHDVLFLERDMSWYAAARDLPEPPWGRTELYGSVDDLSDRYREDLAAADLAVIGSFVPEGPAVADLVFGCSGGAVAFWDIDTPVTVAKLRSLDAEYLAREHVPRFDLYLSFTGGPLLHQLEKEFGARGVHPFFCMADPLAYRPLPEEERWLLGYLGTYSPDRQRTLHRLLVDPARRLPHSRFAVTGAQYPPQIDWPENVVRDEHLPPGEHPTFYARQRFALNVTRLAMIETGWSPSVRLFEAASCGVPVISDRWDGIETFFVPNQEILLADTADDVVRLLQSVDADLARTIGAAARERVLGEHTPERRAEELERHVAALGVTVR